MFNRSKNVHITTKTPLLGTCCYKPFFFTNLNLNGKNYYATWVWKNNPTNQKIR